MNIRRFAEWISRRAVELTAGLTAVVGLLALGAWASGHWQILIAGEPYVPMAGTTAFLFLMLGLATGACHRWPAMRSVRIGAIGVAIGTLIACALMFFQAWSYFPLPWDHLLFDPVSEPGAIPLGRMSPLTALAFIFVATSLLTLIVRPSTTWLRQWLAGGAAMISLVIGLVVVLGHIAGTPLLYGGKTVPMALLTAAIFVLLSLGLLIFSGVVPGLERELRDARELWRIEGERRLQSAALAAAANAIVITDRDGLIVWANAAFTALTGYSLEEAIHKNPRELVRSGQHERAYYAAMWETILAGRVWKGEMVNRRKDGSLYPEEMTITPVRDAAGRITHFIAIKQDLTDAKKTEDTLRRSEALLKESQSIAGLGSYVLDVASGRWQSSEIMDRVFGIDQTYVHDVAGWHALLHPEDRALMADYLENEVLGRGHAFNREYRIIRPTDGAERWVHGIGKLDFDDQGRVLRMYGTIQDITERRQAESALRRERALFARLIRTIPDLIWLKDPQGVFLACNPGFEKLYGAAEADIVGKTDYDFVDKRLADVYREHDRSVMAAAQPNISEAWLTFRSDGRRRLFETIKTSMIDGEGKLIGVLGIARDVTARQEAEERLREEHTLFNSLVSTIPDNIYFKDRQSRFIRINEDMARKFGLASPELAVGKSDNDFFSEEHARQAYDDEQRIMANGEPMIGFVEKETWPDGHVTWVSTTKMPLRDATGAVTGLVGISRDITAIKEAERKLREQGEILSNSHEGVMIVDMDDRISSWNHGAERIFGWTEEEAVGRAPEQALGVDDAGAITSLRQGVLRDGFWNGELKARTRDARALTIEVRTTLVRDEAGQSRARLNLIADVTEQKMLEEKFLHAQRLESIGMLAAGIAHDLNNVLAPIVFAAPMLRNSLTTERDLRILQTLETSAQRGAGLVKQILGFARSATGEFRTTQVKHLVRDIIGVIEETFPKAIELRHEVPSDLWPVHGNATQIHQVLLNLCVNARDAMPQGGTLTLTATNRSFTESEAAELPGARPGEWLMLTVADTGTGIAPDVLEKIWTPFFTTKGAGKGTGLGLTTIRSIVANHQGFISLETTVGTGTTFRVFLPAVDADVKKKKSSTPFGDLQGNGESVLVVDDDTAIRDLVAAILHKAGYRVEKCSDGLEAITLFNAHPAEFDLVVSDVDMPRIGGLVLVRTLLQIRPEIRIIVMSGLSHHEAASPEIPAIRDLAQGYLPKPFLAEELLVAVRKCLHSPTATGSG